MKTIGRMLGKLLKWIESHVIGEHENSFKSNFFMEKCDWCCVSCNLMCWMECGCMNIFVNHAKIIKTNSKYRDLQEDWTSCIDRNSCVKWSLLLKRPRFEVMVKDKVCA